MSVTPAEILALGERLLSGSDETEVRCGVGRIYYACFHLCNLLLREFGRPLPAGGGSHLAVVQALGQHKTSTPIEESIVLNRLASDLDHLRQSRQKADYKITEDFSQKDLRLSLSRAGRIFNDVSAFSSQTGLSECVEAAQRQFPSPEN